MIRRNWEATHIHFFQENDQMGDDYANHQVFVGDDDTESRRSEVIATIRRFMGDLGFAETEGESVGGRGFVIGSAGRWILVGDSAFTYGEDQPAFDAFSVGLSKNFPVVNIYVEDSCMVHLSLFRHGELVDRFWSSPRVGVDFESDEEAAKFAGQPNLWADLLVQRDAMVELGSAWDPMRIDDDYNGVEGTLAKSADLFGMNCETVFVGYTVDSDGIPEKYNDYLDGRPAGWEELHFRRVSQ